MMHASNTRSLLVSGLKIILQMDRWRKTGELRTEHLSFLFLENASEDEKEDFKAEINFMKVIGRHENIVTILGCCTLYDPLCLLVEYAPHGDLLHYLRDLRKKVGDLFNVACRSDVLLHFLPAKKVSFINRLLPIFFE